jgi:uncharacterized protein YecT (DUF1311 family)
MPAVFGHETDIRRGAVSGPRPRETVARLPPSSMILACVMLLPVLSSVEASPSSAGPTDRPDDKKVVEQCLALTSANRAAFANTRGVSGIEVATPEARLRAAAQDARQTPESCIGVVSMSCAGAEGKVSDNGQIACFNRELDVWDARLNDAYRRVISRADTDVRLRFIKVQRAWLTWRDASCAQPNVVFQGTMAGPMQAQCLLDATARQAIWLETWEDR